MTFDAEMEKHAETLRVWCRVQEESRDLDGGNVHLGIAIRALLADWKQLQKQCANEKFGREYAEVERDGLRELIAIQYRVNEDMTKVVQEAEAERDRLRQAEDFNPGNSQEE